MIENGKISESTESIGYLIRDEKLFQGDNYKNGISQIKTEGQRVAKGDPIFRYYTNNEESLTKKIADLDLQIQDALEQSANIYSSDIAVIDRQIEEKLAKIVKMNKLNDIIEYKKEINNALTKKAKLAGELSPSGSYIKERISQRSKLEEQLNSGSEYIEATVSGLVSYKIDGLEEMLTPTSFEKITEEYLKSLKLKTGEMISSSNEGGKIVNNYNCYIATILEPKEAQNAELNKKIQLVLSTGDEVKANIVHVVEQESGNTLVIFEISNSIEKLIPYRKISFEIIWWNANGLKVPNSSILEKDSKSYIIRKRVGYTDNILVKVLKKSENYSIIENYTSSELKELGFSTEEIKNMRSISLYDEILLRPSK
jgi:putative membrane fusion protein